MCTTCYNIETPAVHPHNLFTCSECFPQHIVTIYSHSYHRLVFIMHTDRVLCEATTQFHTLFKDTCRPGISPGPVRADIWLGTAFPVSTAVPPHQCSILTCTLTLVQSEGQAYTFWHKAMLCRISGAVLSHGCSQHSFGHAGRNSALLTAQQLPYSHFAVRHIEWQTADWSIAKDWEGNGHGLIYGTPLKFL